MGVLNFNFAELQKILDTSTEKSMKSIQLKFLAAICLLASSIATADPGDHELISGSYSCITYVSTSNRLDSQNSSIYGTPLAQEYFSCRGPEPANCSAAAAEVAHSLDSSGCANSTSFTPCYNCGHSEYEYSRTSVNWVCEGLRKKVLEAAGDLCKSLF